MANKEYYKKYENKLLISIFDKYVSENGDSLVAVELYEFNSLDNSLYKSIPEITLEKIAGSTLQNSQSHYLGNLEIKGYVKKYGSFNFRLTHSGYKEAKRLKEPIKYFAIKYWQSLSIIILTSIIAIASVMQLIKYK